MEVSSRGMTGLAFIRRIDLQNYILRKVVVCLGLKGCTVAAVEELMTERLVLDDLSPNIEEKNYQFSSSISELVYYI